jgi:hypothetical protein
MGLSVLGTGFGRTGTESMRFALEELGFYPCHHMRQVYADDAQMRLWRDVVVGGHPPDWERLFDGFRAAVDWPSVLYWRELLDAYPDAKVILTNRSPESWWRSYERTLLKVIEHLPGDDMTRRLLDLTFDDRPLDRKHCIAVYETHVREVLDTVPKEQLLVHSLGDGWQPLCDHLGISVPDKFYPQSNAGTSFVSAYRPAPD